MVRTYRHSLARPSSYKVGYSLGKWLPRGALFVLADLLADATHWSNPEPARNLRANLRSAFPRWSEREVEDLSKRIFRNFARNLVDYGRFNTITDEALDRLLPYAHHLHFLEESFSKGRGVILVTGHIGNWELGALFFARHGFKINVVTIPEGRERIDSIRGAYRMRQDIRTIVVDGSPFSPSRSWRRSAGVRSSPCSWTGGRVPTASRRNSSARIVVSLAARSS